MSTATSDTAVFDEAAARRVLLLRACESAPAGELPSAWWSAEDGAWATRAANEAAGTAAAPAAWLDVRARLACERLLPRSAVLEAVATRRGWRAGWAWAALLLGLVAGIAGDALGGTTLNLLAPPWLAVLGWNLLVYLFLLYVALRPRRAPPRGAGLRRAVARWLRARLLPARGGRIAPLARFAADWARRSAAPMRARAALLLHLAAAALAGGLVAGMYLRGLVFDFRAGWQSTFLEPGAVHALLATLLAPAAAATGIALPDGPGFAALRLAPGAVATASAAPWIHLYAATLAMAVVLPRLVLAAAAALAALRARRRFAVDLGEPYFQRLFVQAERAQAALAVLPHGTAPTAAAVLGLRAALARVFGEPMQLQFAAPVAYGDEDAPAHDGAAIAANALRIALFDAAATPEAEAQGRFLAALGAPAARGGSAARPPLVVLDTGAVERRFAALPARVAERRAAWQQLADAHGLALAAFALDAADPGAGAAALEAALADAASRPAMAPA